MKAVRLLAAAALLGLALAWTAVGVAAADHPTAALKNAPKIFLVSPTKVNLKVQPNVVITGQNLASTTRVAVGGHPATTVEAPDSNHLLVQIPADLADGVYIIQASNGDAISTADQTLTVQAGSPLDQMNMLLLAGGGLLVLLAARLARFQTF